MTSQLITMPCSGFQRMLYPLISSLLKTKQTRKMVTPLREMKAAQMILHMTTVTPSYHFLFMREQKMMRFVLSSMVTTLLIGLLLVIVLSMNSTHLSLPPWHSQLSFHMPPEILLILHESILFPLQMASNTW